MIDQTHLTATDHDLPRDERSMRLMEYAMAVMALAAALLIAIR